jgi:tetratricopeptide (TPR) repeat protein
MEGLEPAMSDPQEPNPSERKPRGVTVVVTTRQMLRWMFWLIVVWLLVERLPREVCYWKLAAAEKASLAGRQDEALDLVHQAESWAPEDPFIEETLLRVKLRGAKGDWLAATDQLLQGDLSNGRKADLHLRRFKHFAEKEKNWEQALSEWDAAANFDASLRPHWERVKLLIKVGRNDEAVREIQQLDVPSGEWLEDASNRDNSVAYMSAVVGHNLPAALERVNQALKHHPQEAMYLDTRGFILHKLGRSEEALADLNQAIESFEKQWGATPSAQLVREALAVMIYHRSLVFGTLEISAQAEQDRQRVQKLGFEPNDRLF